MKSYLQSIMENQDYKEFLAILSGLSRLFSNGSVPYLDYRIVENLFCKCFGAVDLAREDSSYDALKWGIGVGLKTFVFNGTSNKATNQKIAEFDALASQLMGLDAVSAVQTISQWRNTRIATADVAHGVTGQSIYHIVARTDSLLRLFVVPYDPIDITAIRLDKNKSQVGKSLVFTDGKHDYSFYYSKSTLSERFDIPPVGNYVDIPVAIHVDPYELLRRLADNKYGAKIVSRLPSHRLLTKVDIQSTLAPVFDTPHEDCVILPLYSTALHGEVSPKSGLNQWNAEGRPRDPDEVYIPIPQSVHDEDAGFFPDRDRTFRLKLPNGSILTAKVCQQGRKALMSNPNKALGKWLLRDVLRIPVGRIVTREMLDIAGFDSIVVVKESTSVYRIELSRQAHYRNYMTGNETTDWECPRMTAITHFWSTRAESDGDDLDSIRSTSRGDALTLSQDVPDWEKFITFLPVYSLRAACGRFGDGEEVEMEGWVKVDRPGLTKEMFVVRASGRSMEPKIHDGDLCVFRAHPAGSREGKIVLAQHRNVVDPDSGGAYSIKEYSSVKKVTGEDEWEHESITLKPLNPDYDPISLQPDEENKIVGELVHVL